jgi:CDP-paratose 2-epimerase
MSLSELRFLRKTERSVPYEHADWRPGDQRVYVSDIAKAKEQLGWAPGICLKQGLDRLFDWVSLNKELFQ